MGKKHKKHKAEKTEWRSASATAYSDYVDKPLEKPLKLVLKVGGSEVTELSGSGHDSSYYDDRSDHERERHKEKKKKKKKKSEKEKDKHLDDEERRKRKLKMKARRSSNYWNTSFASFKVTDAIAPGYSMIIKHPMDFGTMKEKIAANEYKSVTEFKADFKLMCDNAMTYNRPDTVYYKLAKKILHTGFKMMSKERLLALKRSMSFMQDMDFSQQAALLGDEDTAVEEPVPEVVPVQAETTKKSKKQNKEVISKTFLCIGSESLYREKFLAKQMEEDTPGERNGFGVRRCSTQYLSCIFEPEGNACSLTDSTAEEHVLALVEHAADEARDRINRYLPNSKIGYLKKNGDGTLLFSVVNSSDPEAEEEETHPVDLSSLSSKLLPGFTTLGFKDERRNKVTFLTSASTVPSMQNNSIFHDLKSDEMELLYSAYGDETGIQCALSLQEFVKDAGNYSKKIVDDLLDQITSGDHSKTIYQLKQRRNIPVKPLDEVKVLPVLIKEEHKLRNTCPDSSKQIMVGESAGDSNTSDLDFLSMKPYSDVSLDISMLSSLGKVKKELDHDDNHLHLDETTKLLQDLHEAQADRVGSRPSSNLSSLSNTSERDQHHLGSPSHLSVGEQQDLVHDPYEFLQSPETSNATTN
ncbi:bromodomain-containing protein 9 isoform X10 [Grus americana]|uniref:bromodomain-containing protein 9 isoform X10 n=1 Tax=Grus americana TaxID=9117 RepID=UPI0024079588|nr:bromodomain-containing protein 9 isoform X10 [Grus americana]